MRTLVMTAIGQLEIHERPDPSPRGDEVLIEVIATGICGSDFHGFSGHNGRRFPGQIMGHESVGTVRTPPADNPDKLTVGDVVTFNPLLVTAEESEEYAGREQHSPGRRVIGVEPSIQAAFAELISVPARNVFRLAAGIPPEWGALIEPLAVALNAVQRAGVRPGSSVLVIGGGPIGQSCVLAARRAGATRVFLSEPSQSRRDLCRKLGAEPIDPEAGDLRAQLEALGAGPVEFSIDAVGITPTVAAALDATRFGGTVCLVGMGTPELTLPAFRISTEERSLVGAFCYPNETFASAVDWVNEGTERFDLLVSERVTLEDAEEAFQRLVRGEDVPGKILVFPGRSSASTTPAQPIPS